MKKEISTSLRLAEIIGFMIILLVYIVNTDRPYLIGIPVAGTMIGYFVFPFLLRQWMDRKLGNMVWGILILSGLLVLFIALSTFGLLSVIGGRVVK